MRTALRRDLTSAIRTGDRAAVSALRSALAAIENAEAVPADQHPTVDGSGHGAGAGDVARRVLTDAEVAEIVEREVRDRSDSAAQYHDLGRHEHARRLRAEADVLSRYLHPDAPGSRAGDE